MMTNPAQYLRDVCADPQSGSEHYGKWGALTFMQRKYLRDIADFMDAQDNKIAQLEAELAELREAARWIPVGERLPEKNDWILGYTSATRSTQASIEKSRGFMLSLRGCDITHWRPLPKPPEAKGE